jgi:acid phosphatase (class A)
MAAPAKPPTTTCATTGAAAAEALYAAPAFLEAVRRLPPPPVEESARRQDLEAVQAAQRSRTPAQAAEAEANIAVDPFLFAAVLGPRFTAETAPNTASFLQRVCRSTLPHLQVIKDCWNRPRPFMVDPTLVPLERSLASTKLRSAPAPAPKESLPPQVESPCTAPVAGTSYASSYPSGHAAVGVMLAIVLGEMIPEQRAPLLVFGREYGNARVISGVHFPSDVEAGRILGALLAELMQQDARFQNDLCSARSELRLVLGCG